MVSQLIDAPVASADHVAAQAAVLAALRSITGADVVWPSTRLADLGAGPAVLAKVALVLSRDLRTAVLPDDLAHADTVADLVAGVPARAC